jgi:ABC-type uncharacterized transport system involved in gliding motility auxiliary subunit
MINIFLFIFCLVNSHIVDGTQGTIYEDLVQLEKAATANVFKINPSYINIVLIA